MRRSPRNNEHWRLNHYQPPATLIMPIRFSTPGESTRAKRKRKRRSSWRRISGYHIIISTTFIAIKVIMHRLSKNLRRAKSCEMKLKPQSWSERVLLKVDGRDSAGGDCG